MRKWLLPAGRSFYAVGLAFLGLMHFFYRNFPRVVVPEFPGWIPFHVLWIFAVGTVLTAAGTAILFRRRGRQVAAWTGVGLLVLVVIAHLPSQLSSAYVGVLGSWTNVFKEVALAGGAWVAAQSFTEQSDERIPAWLEKLLPLGRYFFAVLLVVFGSEHFLYSKFVAALVPGWVGSATFWTYFAGAALIAGGMGIVVQQVARAASLLTGLMIFLWVIMLHIPRAIVDPYSNVGNEWASVFEALAFSGMAWMLAAMPRVSSK